MVCFFEQPVDDKVVNYNIVLQTFHECLPGYSAPQNMRLLTYVVQPRVPSTFHCRSERYYQVLKLHYMVSDSGTNVQKLVLFVKHSKALGGKHNSTHNKIHNHG